MVPGTVRPIHPVRPEVGGDRSGGGDRRCGVEEGSVSTSDDVQPQRQLPQGDRHGGTSLGDVGVGERQRTVVEDPDGDGRVGELAFDAIEQRADVARAAVERWVRCGTVTVTVRIRDGGDEVGPPAHLADIASI